MAKQKSEILDYLRDLAIGFGGTITLLLTLNEVLQRFGIKLDWLNVLGVYGIYLMVVHALLGAFIYSTIMLAIRLRIAKRDNKNTVDQDHDDNALKLSFELVKIVEHSYKAKNYVDVVRFGSQLSRPLWLSGMYHERIRIGQMIEDSASRVGMYEEQVIALIDDIGWTNAVTGNLDKAETHISDGVKLALEKRNFYYAAKGERHLAIMAERYKGKIDEANAHFEEALRITEMISDQNDREEMRAGILYGTAELCIVEKAFSKALSLALESKELYEKLGEQEERLVKSRSQLGKIYLELNEIQKAKDYFRVGLDEAQRLQRQDEIAINLLGLGEVNFKTQEYNVAIELLTEAIVILKEANMKHELKKAIDLELRAQLESRSYPK